MKTQLSRRYSEKNNQSTAYTATFTAIETSFSVFKCDFPEAFELYFFFFLNLREVCRDLMKHREMPVLTDSFNKIMVYLRS